MTTHDTLHEDVAAAVRRHREQHGVTLTAAAEQAGLDIDTLKRVERVAGTPSGPVTLAVLMAVLDWLGLELMVRTKPVAKPDTARRPRGEAAP